MTALLTLGVAKASIFRNFIASARTESKLKMAVVLIFACALWVGTFLLFFWAFDYLRNSFDMAMSDNEKQSVGDVIMVRMLSLLFLALFILLAFSNALISFTTMYRSEEVEFLMTTPMAIKELFVARFVECVFLSSWAFLFLGSPLLLSYGLVNKVPWFFYLISLVFYFPFVVIPAALGTIFTMILIKIFPNLSKRSFILIALTCVVVFFMRLRQMLRVEHLSRDPEVFGHLLSALKNTQSPLLPSYWAAEGVLQSGFGDLMQSLFYFLVLLSNVLLCFAVTLALVPKLYYSGWSSLRGSAVSRYRRSAFSLDLLKPLFAFLKTQDRCFVMKDLKLFWRDPAQWSQFIVFFGLMAIYMANLRNAPYYAWMDREGWKNMVSFLNLTAISLILATLTSRFIFPLLSLEGRRFWIVGLAPIEVRRIVFQKFWLSFSTSLVFTLGLIVLSDMVLRVTPEVFALSVLTIVAMNFSLAGLAVGLGAIFPNFKEDNTAKIVSGMGGTLNFLLSIFYIGVVVAAEAAVVHLNILGRWGKTYPLYLAITVTFVLSLSALTTCLPLHLGIKSLKAAEF